MTYAININVPACPNCKGALKRSHITHDYICRNCKRFYMIVGSGATEREMLCKERKANE